MAWRLLGGTLKSWLEIVDLDRACKTVRTDIFGDWYRDPWGWPETEWLASAEGHRHVLHALESTDPRRGTPLDVPKENFSTRPAYVFDPVERLIFQALIDRISKQLVGSMPRWSYSWRLSRKKPQAGHYVDMRSEWKGYRRRLSLLSGVYDCALTTDIVSFFPSIPVDKLVALVNEVCGKSDVASRVVELLNSWTRISGRGGLPMRANASSILANSYLRPVDDLLRNAGMALASDKLLNRYERGEGTAARWVDDMWIFGDDIAQLRSVQLDVQETLRSLGLNINLGKTRVLSGEEMVAAARQLEHSAVDLGLDAETPNFVALDKLLDGILSNPESASHTSLRFATVRMRRQENYSRVDDLLSIAQRMPHGAEHLARLFRDSGRYSDLGPWFEEYLYTPWAKMQLAAARFAMMFPSSKVPPACVQDVLISKIRQPCELPLFAIAAQRLASWDSATARPVLREAARHANHPHFRRVIAFAALNAGEQRSWIRGLLSELHENDVTLQFLESRSFRPVDPQSDFSGF